MIELSKQQRLEAYRYALEMLMTGGNNAYEKYNYPHVCLALCEWFENEVGEFITTYDAQELFPEFGTYKPSMIGSSLQWWPEEDIQSRIDLLNHIITEMEKEVLA